MIIEDKPDRNSSADWWCDRISTLLIQQKILWPLLKNNYEGLLRTKTRKLKIDDLSYVIKYNSIRAKINSNEINEASKEQVKCSYCIHSIPEEQNALLYNRNFLILCNPHPTFQDHFIITKKKHVAQSIIGNFEVLLNLTYDLGKFFTLIYNGPKSGALSSNHMQFEAVTKNVIPLESDFEKLVAKFSRLVLRNGKIEVRFFEEHLRYFISMESRDKGELLYAFKTFVNAFRKISPPHEEPLMNILSSYQERIWRLIFFPRWDYSDEQFSTNKNHPAINLSTTEMGGLFNVSRAMDFKRLSKKEISEIYRRTTVSKEYFEFIRKKIGEIFI